MPAGVEGFVPGRLKIAREARALRQSELALLLERSASTISKWESDDHQQRPEPSILDRLAATLNVEASWFFKPLVGKHSASFFRSLVSELELVRVKTRARLTFVSEIYSTVSEFVELPENTIPELVGKEEYLEFRSSDIEAIASSLRESWGLGDEPIENLLMVIENAGVIVAQDQIGSVKLDGLSRWSYEIDRPFILLAQDKNTSVRRRLDAAHELGHLVLHKHVSAESLAKNFRLIEEQAMVFAGAFLLPAETYRYDLHSLSLDAMLSMKTRWKVSVGAQIKRLSNLGVFSENFERRLWQYYSYRKWRLKEPLDGDIEIEQPDNLKTSIEMILDDGQLSRTELRRETGLSYPDISTLTGVSLQYLESSSDNVVRLAPKVRSASSSGDSEGNVIPLDFLRK